MISNRLLDVMLHGKVIVMIDRGEFEAYLSALAPDHNFCLVSYAKSMVSRRDEWCPLASFLRDTKGMANALVSTSQITGVGITPPPLLEHWQQVFVSVFDRETWSSRSSTRPPTAKLALEVLGAIRA